MKNSTVIWILKQIRRRIPAIMLMTAAQIGQALLSVLFALGSRGIIDSAVSGSRDAFVDACKCQLAVIAGIILCTFLVRHLRERLRADLEMDWKRKLLHGLLHGEYAQVKAYHSAELLNRLNNDVSKVNEGVLTIIPTGAAMIVRLIAAVVVLGALAPKFTCVIALVGVCVIAVTGLLRRHLKELNKQVSTHDGKVSGFLQEIMEKLLIVQSMDVSQEVEHRGDVLLENRYLIQRKRKNISLLSNTCVSILYYGAGFLALTWCARSLLLGQMSFGSLTAVVQLVGQLQAPFVNLSGVMPQYLATLAAGERLRELETIQGEPESMKHEPEHVYGKMDYICAEGIHFSYDRDQVLKNASFMLPKGAFAVITGPSGIGKSTLLKLLLGVFKLDEGKLYLDCGGEQFRLDRSTRKLFAYVPQGNLLLSGTLRDNLTIVKPSATQQELEQAIYVSAMDEFLPELPHGLDTVLGEDGAGLSEGQAQRLVIARAVLGDAPILLLDECTSALDEATENTVLRRIKALPNRTTIAVTHRPAAVNLCNWKLEVDNGKIHSAPMTNKE